MIKILIVLSLLFTAIYAIVTWEPRIMSKSSIDGNLYNVLAAKGHENVADRLSIMRKDIDKLVSFVGNKKLADRWANCKLVEISKYDEHMSYTYNKSESINMCISTDGKLEDYNIGMRVLIHELAHVMTDSHGHTEEFQRNFSKLIAAAEHIGIYKAVDLNSTPVVYCGFVIR